jgi:hypothetical protein
VASTSLAPFAIALRRLVVGADVVRSPGDLHGLGFSQGEGIDGTCRPVPTRLAMAIAHPDRLTADRELNRATKTAALVRFPVAHDAPPW